MKPSPHPLITLVSPGVRAANNGNWHTAWRWSRFLADGHHVDLGQAWAPGQSSPQCLIALHARRSAASLASYAEAFPGRPAVLVLTGTDLYRDLPDDATAQRSLDVASHIVVLQEAALDDVPRGHRAKCRVIYQSARSLAPGTPRRTTFDVVLVGHLRDEKDPLTPMRAIVRLPADSRVRLIHIGAALDDALGNAARDLDARRWASRARYRWLGARPHAETRRRIRDARLMVISSRMEGGANVIVEAVTAGVPVLASRIPGNVGMLGRDYEGYFALGDDADLAHLFERASADAAFLARLCEQCAARAHLFAPARERDAVRLLANEVFATRAGPTCGVATS
jgi:putative glycosyltransferase (TIGR04348 family)